MSEWQALFVLKAKEADDVVEHGRDDEDEDEDDPEADPADDDIDSIADPYPDPFKL